MEIKKSIFDIIGLNDDSDFDDGIVEESAEPVIPPVEYYDTDDGNDEYGPDEYVQGIDGRYGSRGPQGARGFQGMQGIQGKVGRRGSQGTRGCQGITGADGMDGAQGTQGRHGRTGSQGARGCQGVTGADGMDGAQGTQGRHGRTGSQGIRGTQGVRGAQGTEGYAGYEGYRGKAGMQGLQGQRGIQGAQGLQGVYGYRGSEGSVGIQGLVGSEGSIWSDGMRVNGTNSHLFRYSDGRYRSGNGIIKVYDGSRIDIVLDAESLSYIRENDSCAVIDVYDEESGEVISKRYRLKYNDTVDLASVVSECDFGAMTLEYYDGAFHVVGGLKSSESRGSALFKGNEVGKDGQVNRLKKPIPGDMYLNRKTGMYYFLGIDNRWHLPKKKIYYILSESNLEHPSFSIDTWSVEKPSVEKESGVWYIWSVTYDEINEPDEAQYSYNVYSSSLNMGTFSI